MKILLWACFCSMLALGCGIPGHSHGSNHGEAPHDEGESHPTTAIVLTTISGMSAVLGGVIVIVVGVPSKAVLGHLLSFAAGVMLYVSYADMLPSSVKQTGWQAGFWFFAGAIGFMGLASLLPEPELSDLGAQHDQPATRPRGGSATAPLADASEQLTTIAEESPNRDDQKLRQRRPRSGSRQRAGPPAMTNGGIAIASKQAEAVLDPEEQVQTLAKTSDRKSAAGGMTLAERRRIMVTGLVAALGIALHNLPEGLIVYTQAMPGICSPASQPVDGVCEVEGGCDQGEIGWGEVLLPGGVSRVLDRCMSRGVVITLAIALHNIPEGMAVASPILASTGSWWEALKWTVVTSAFEPIAAILFGWAIGAQMSAALAANISAAVAGIMVILCVQELIPSAAEHVKDGRAVALSNLVGQGLMWASMTFLTG